MVALAVQLHEHFGTPRQPKLYTTMLKIHRSVIHDQMIARKLEPGDRLGKIGFNSQKIEAGGRQPKAPFQRNIHNLSIFSPLPKRSAGVVAFLEANLPGGLTTQSAKAFAFIVEAGRSEERHVGK